MIMKRPMAGYGPGNFYENYKKFTLTDFKTYVSDNPDHSGIHNYYLMTLVEQGVVGFIVFVLLLVYILIYGENIYHRCRHPRNKELVMSALMTIVIIASVNTMNDMMEVIKVGPFFFFSCFIIVSRDLMLIKQK